MKKSDVNGDDANEVYKYLKSQKSGILGLTRIKACLIFFDLIFSKLIVVQWNFEKFLIDKQGNVVNRWASTTTPQAIDSEIAKLV
jgi:peroxiredoxin